MSCNAKLAKGQWWNFCGETDMGQTLLVQCTCCGGEYIRADDPNAEERVKELDVIQKREYAEFLEQEKKIKWKRPTIPWKIMDLPVSDDPFDTGYKLGPPQFIMIKQSPTSTERTERVLREHINPFDLKLDEENTKLLEVMINNAAKEIVQICGGITEKQDWERMMKL